MDTSKAALAFTIITACLAGWNAYRNMVIGKIIAELQLNMMQTFNGRYIRIDSFSDAKARITRLEEQHDKEAEDRLRGRVTS